MYRGRVQVGKAVLLAVQCRNASRAAVPPDACPTVDVYDSAGKRLAGKAIPILDPAATTGLFAYWLYLSDAYATGRATATYRWTVSTFHGSDLDTFDVLAGGDPSGAVIAQCFFQQPQANFVVQQRDGGRIYKGKNPRL